jgi:hypothetical protein
MRVVLVSFRFCQQPTAKAVGYWQNPEVSRNLIKSDKLL